MSKPRLSDFLHHLRQTHPDMVRIFSNGGCFQLYRMIKMFIPQAIAHYSQDAGHVYVEVEGRFYDITGEVTPPEDAEPMSKQLRRRACRWSRQQFPSGA